MSLRSLYHYHAEWSPMTEKWINAEGCEPTAEVIQPAPDNLCLLLRTTAVNQHISVWAHTKNWGIATAMSKTSQDHYQECLDQVGRHRGIHLHTYFILHSITATIWHLAPSAWAVLFLHLLSLSSCTPSSQRRALKYEDPVTARLTPRSNCTAIKAWFKIKSARSAMLLLLSDLPTFLFFPPLFILSISPASHTDEQMPTWHRFHIYDYWLLTPNERPLPDQCRTHLQLRAQFSKTEQRPYLSFL